MHKSFAFRLAAAFAGIGIAAASLTAILVNVAFGARFTGYIEQQRDVRQQQLAIALGDSYRRMGGWNVPDLNRLAPAVLMDGGTLRLEDAGGRIVWRPTEAPLGERMAEMHRLMMGTGSLGPERNVPIRSGGARVGTAIVRLPEAGLLPQDVAFRRSVNRLLLLGGVIAALAALVLGAALAQRATAPARALTSAARALARGDRSVRVGFEGADEFGDMARSFDRMAIALEEEDRLRRTFAADVAHELRTPLSILLSQVEAVQDGVVENAPSAFESLHEEVLRLSRLVQDLETVASADAAGFSLARRPVALRPILEDAAREFLGQSESRGLSLEVDVADVDAWVDPTRLRQIVANLLSNALKFTPEGGRVQLGLRAEGDEAVIRVEDSGPGIPADELPRVFDRFFRGRGARAGGSGIGLTVVKDLATAHEGSVEVASELGRGTTFTVRLPCAPPAGA